LNCNYTKVIDLTPLKDMKTLITERRAKGFKFLGT
jgi:hypothetical protein